MKKFLILIFATTGFSLFAQNGNLDPDFNGNGKVLTDLAVGFREILWDIAIQPDEKIVVAGTAQLNTYDFAVLRYNPDGSLDDTFGGTGSKTYDINQNSDVASSLLILPDGKIILGGWSRPVNSFDYTLLRYTTGGILDNTFGVGGVVTLDFGNNVVDYIYDIALQNDGKIIAVGQSDNKCAIARFNNNGTIDNTFSFDGKATLEISPTAISEISKVLIQPDGKIVCIGYVSASGGLTDDGVVLRYNTDGTLDNSFNGNGILRFDAGNQQNDLLNTGVLLPNGQIIAAGTALVQSDNDFLLVKFNSDGTPDQNFSNDGIITTNLTGVANDVIKSIIIEPGSNKIIAAGYTDADAAVVRYNADGLLDNTWANNGMSIIDVSGTAVADDLNSICLQADGKLLACGKTNISNTDYKMIVLRYITGLTIGITEFSTDNTFLVYPNPIQNIETLKYTLTENETISVKLLDNTGRLITTFIDNQARKKGDNTEVLTMPENLVQGNYLLQISSSKGKVSIRILK